MLRQCVLFYILVFEGFFLKSSSICDCNNRLRSVCVGPSDPVFVPCPAMDQGSEDFRLELLQNQTLISSFCSNCGPAPASLTTVRLANEGSQRGFNVTVSDWSSHGLYVCEGKSKLPPPIVKKSGPEQVLILIRGHQCDLKLDHRLDPGHHPGWIITVVCLSSYSLLISIICTLLWVKFRSSECERDYVNTKPPSTHRHRRKKRKEINVIT